MHLHNNCNHPSKHHSSYLSEANSDAQIRKADGNAIRLDILTSVGVIPGNMDEKEMALA